MVNNFNALNSDLTNGMGSPVGQTPIYDIAIVGGGLAGLALSIQSARAGFSTVLFEKETYPFHRVCGEYISFESWNFLEELGVPLSDLGLPVIKKLIVTAPNGRKLEHELPLGGFGISRYKLDQLLADIAVKNGVTLHTGHRVNDVQFVDDHFAIDVSGSAPRNEGKILSKIAVGSFGKRANLDIRWKRDFAVKKPGKLDNYIGVKYHIRYPFPDDTIALHNFQNGYCGISRIEDGKCCLCYLATASELKEAGNSIKALEQRFLFRNPWLAEIFSTAEFLFPEPVVISQISFNRKSALENHVLMAGDAAGMITPLCGNGMSMAMHGSKIAFSYIRQYLEKQIDRERMEWEYEAEWRRLFHKRLVAGRLVQGLFGQEMLTNILIQALKPFPKFTTYLIRQTHGEPY